MHITLYIIMIVFPINLLANYVFLMHFKMGYRGAVFHSLVFEGSLAILYIIFILRVPNVRQYWPGFSLECFHSWGEYLKLGIPGMLSVSTDWAFEVCAIVTGKIFK